MQTFRPDEISSGTRTITKSSSQGRAPKRLSKFTHEQLSEIFKKIGSKHQVQEVSFSDYCPENDVFFCTAAFAQVSIPMKLAKSSLHTDSPYFNFNETKKIVQKAGVLKNGCKRLQGLAQLYDFKLQHPEADVQPFLVKSHQFFQDFIEQGLKDIDQARKSQNINAQCNNQYTTGE